MEITDVSFMIRDNVQLKVFVKVIFADEFVVHGIKIIFQEDRYFISMPAYRLRNGRYRDWAHPITAEFRDKLEKRVLSEYFLKIRLNY